MAVKGGDKFERYMEGMRERLNRPGSQVRVGFLSRAKYPDGKPVAMIAAIQNWGAPRAGIPPRPFFSNMIAAKGPEWPAAIATQLRLNDYDRRATLLRVGEGVAGQLRQSVIDTNRPPLAESTIARKGFSKPLVETGHMLNSIDYEIVE